jgi:hypothetical protein
MCSTLRHGNTGKAPPTVNYPSGTSATLGPEWGVLEVASKRKDHGVMRTSSVVIARDARGTIIRQVDSSPEQWVVIHNPETLRAYRKWFDTKDRLAAGKAAGVGRKVEEE